VGSWLEARSLRCIWHQVDVGDSDVSTFFYFLREGLVALRAQARLPLLTAEYLHDVPGFSRRFFREAFSQLPNDSVLVLDNYQEIPLEHRLHALIAEASDEVPEHVAIVVISRMDPPTDYARLRANDALSVIGWEALKLSQEETTSLIEARVQLPAETTQRLWEQSDGWAAGLTLLVESMHTPSVAAHASLVGRDALFAYFASQSFDRFSRSTQEFLVITALLPQVPVSLALQITESSMAGEILEDLFQRHLFTHRRDGSERIYWYHALFRDFLLSRLGKLLGTEGAIAARRRAAHLLDKRGDFQGAFDLYVATKDWHAAAALSERAAQILLEQGRGQTLREWVSALPESDVAARPWLQYWVGLSLIPIDPVEARARLELVLPLFSIGDDIAAESLCMAAIIDTYFYEWAAFKPVREWVDQLERLYQRLPVATSPRILRRVQASLLVGMLYVAPGNPLLPMIVQRVARTLEESTEVNTLAETGIILLTYCDLACDLPLGQWVVKQCSSAVASKDLLPRNDLWWQLRLGYFLELSGNYVEARKALDRAIEVCEQHGFRGLQSVFPLIASYQVTLACSVGNVDEVQRWVQRMSATVDPLRPLDHWLNDDARAMSACLKGDYSHMAELNEALIPQIVSTGVVFVELLRLMNWAIARAILGEADSYRRAIARLYELARDSCFAYFECAGHFLEAYFALVHDRSANASHLVRSALTRARQQEFSYLQMIRCAGVVPELFGYALRHGIEQDYVVETIQRLSIRAPASAPANWPWPVQIRTLGAFEVFSDGRKLEFSGKAPKKPLQLLKVLVAYGGRSVPEHRVIDAIWPDEEADLATKSLDVTLTRLRKLLGTQQAIVFNDETLSLNPEVVWIDVWTFERLAESAFEAKDKVADQVWQDAFELYKGDLMPAEAAAPWSLKGRERLRSIFLRFVERAGRQLEAAQQWQAAISCYEKGLAADDLAEPFYQGLMRCYRALDRRAEAMSAYRKLRHVLSVVLGMAPSEASQTLARQLQSESPAQS
jgi:ATP/maltotriose-dependent transcriptional regulator MalT/two-component SAPR family response regulator